MKRLLAILGFLLLFCPVWAFGQSSWSSISPKEREALQRKYREWKELPESDKAVVEENYRRWKQLPNYEKQELQKRWQYWQGLPKDRRDSLKQRFRQQFREGPKRKRNR